MARGVEDVDEPPLAEVDHVAVLEVAVQNFNLALVLALTILQERLYLGPALVYLPVMLAFAGIFVLGSLWTQPRRVR